MKYKDEYNWSTYTKNYRDQIDQMINIKKREFFVKNFEIVNDQIIVKDNIHPNSKELYSIIYKLKPKSVYECGVGGCYHLKNINMILPRLKITGSDLLETQLKFGKQFSQLPDSIDSSLRVIDMTKELPDDVGKFELVYTQAVIMHLSTKNAKLFLENMNRLSEKYIILIESSNNHENFYDFVKETLPGYKFELTNQYITNGIILTKTEIVTNKY